MSGVFKNFCFIIVDNWHKRENIENLLEENGCQYAKIVPTGTLSGYLKSATSDLPDFIICDSNTDGLLPLALKLMIPVVRSEWVDHCIDQNKIIPVEPFQYLIRAGQGNMKIHISRYSFNEHERRFLSNLVYLLGGYVTESVSPSSMTHYITRAGEEDSDKIQKAMTISGNYFDTEFVDEKWLLGKFYESQYNTQILETVDEESDCFYDNSDKLIFKGYKFMIDLQMCKSLISHLSSMIKMYGGSVISKEQFEIENEYSRSTTVYLSEFNGNEMIRVNCSMKFNLQWVFDCFLQHQFILNKFQEMIHSIPTATQRHICDNMKISYTHFFGLKRHNIINQIEMLGGEAQPFVCKDTDLIIVGKPQDSKYEYAKKNDICMVTSQWLEDSFKANERVPYFVYDPLTQHKKDQSKPKNLNSQLKRHYVHLEINADFNTRDDMDDDLNDLTTTPINGKDAIITSSPSSMEEHEHMNSSEKEDNLEVPWSEQEDDLDTSWSEPDEIHTGSLETASFMRVGKVKKLKIDLKDVSDLEYGNAIEAKSDLKVGNDTEDHSDKEGKSEVKVGNDLEIGHATEDKSDTKVDNAIAAKSGLKVGNDTEVDNVIEANNDTEGKSEVKFGSDIEANNDLKVGNDTEANNDTEGKSEVKACSGIEAKSDMKGNSDNEGNTGTKVYNSKEMAFESVVASAPTKGKRTRDSSTTITSSTTSGDEIKRVAKRKRVDEPLKEQLPIDDTERIYDIHCVSTQCLDKLSAHDRELLKLVGIHVYDEINNENIGHLNTVIAPKRIRTLKFLISLSFEPLKYALLPKFIMTILKSIKNALKRGDGINDLIRLDPLEYTIPGMDETILKKIELSHGNNNNNNKVFSRSKISSINLSANIQGGTNTLTSILQRHGIERVNVLNKKFSIEDIVSNDHSSFENDEEIPDYILITDQQSQMKQFKSVMQEQFKSAIPKRRVLIVEWNWCVQCIFNLEVSYEKKNSAILYYE